MKKWQANFTVTHLKLLDLEKKLNYSLGKQKAKKRGRRFDKHLSMSGGHRA